MLGRGARQPPACQALTCSRGDSKKGLRTLELEAGERWAQGGQGASHPLICFHCLEA